MVWLKNVPDESKSTPYVSVRRMSYIAAAAGYHAFKKGIVLAHLGPNVD